MAKIQLKMRLKCPVCSHTLRALPDRAIVAANFGRKGKVMIVGKPVKWRAATIMADVYECENANCGFQFSPVGATTAGTYQLQSASAGTFPK